MSYLEKFKVVIALLSVVLVLAFIGFPYQKLLGNKFSVQHFPVSEILEVKAVNNVAEIIIPADAKQVNLYDNNLIDLRNRKLAAKFFTNHVGELVFSSSEVKLYNFIDNKSVRNKKALSRKIKNISISATGVLTAQSSKKDYLVYDFKSKEYFEDPELIKGEAFKEYFTIDRQEQVVKVTREKDVSLDYVMLVARDIDGAEVAVYVIDFSTNQELDLLEVKKDLMAVESPNDLYFADSKVNFELSDSARGGRLLQTLSPSPTPTVEPQPSDTTPESCSASASVSSTSCFEGASEDCSLYVDISMDDNCTFGGVSASGGPVAGKKASVLPPKLKASFVYDENGYPVEYKSDGSHRWFGLVKNPPMEAYCSSDTGEYKYKFTFKFIDKVTGDTLTMHQEASFNIMLRSRNDDAFSSPNPMLITNIQRKVSNNICCASMVRVKAIVDNVEVRCDPKNDQFDDLACQEENRHALQQKGKLPLSQGGIELDSLNKTLASINKQQNGLVTCVKPTFIGIVNACKIATRRVGKKGKKVFDPVTKDFYSQGKLGSCWREYTVKRDIGLVQAKGGYHYECAYPDCPRDIKQPAPWKYVKK